LTRLARFVARTDDDAAGDAAQVPARSEAAQEVLLPRLWQRFALVGRHDEQRRRAIAAWQSLPEEYRLPLTLRYLNEADYDTIAKQLALSNGALRGLLQRGMKLMRERLRENNER
jgi:DNA-directed RNA polymerase specialized sigma24 family protein